MKRIIIAGTIALLATVFLGSLFHIEHTLLILTSGSIEFQVIRLALIGLLAALLIWSPPRSLDFRTILGAVSAVLTFGTAFMLSNYQIGIFDALIFIEVALIFALESAEASLLVKRPAKKIPVSFQ